MDWKEWRSKGLGASDAPIVMGVSPWTTRYQLWEEKTGLKLNNRSNNWATRRGNEMEPKARAHYELIHGIEMPVAFIEHKEYPFIRASLDGYNEEHKIILEIKCPGAADHLLAAEGKVPEKYYPQLQHQLLVTGAKEVHYYSFDGESGHLVVVRPDLEYIQNLFNELSKFWELVVKKTPPSLSNKDYKKVRDAELKSMIERWQVLNSELESKSKELESIRDQIIDKLPHTNVTHNGVKIFKAYRNGSIDYAKIPELKGINLEEFRKPGTSYYTFKRETPIGCRESAASTD